MYRRYHLPPSLLEQTLNPGAPQAAMSSLAALPTPYRDYFASPDGIFTPPPGALQQQWNNSTRVRGTSSRRQRPEDVIRERRRPSDVASQVSLQSYSQRPLTQQSIGTQSQYDRFSLPPLSQDSFGDHLTFDSSQPGPSQLHMGTQDSLVDALYPSTQGDIMMMGYKTQQF